MSIHDLKTWIGILLLFIGAAFGAITWIDAHLDGKLDLVLEKLGQLEATVPRRK